MNKNKVVQNTFILFLVIAAHDDRPVWILSLFYSSLQYKLSS